jgi:ParB family chromosome partitioning protein
VAAPGLTDIAERLSERFETRCRVELGQRKGKIAIEFASLDDLDRILGILEPSAKSR